MWVVVLLCVSAGDGVDSRESDVLPVSVAFTASDTVNVGVATSDAVGDGRFDSVRFPGSEKVA